MDGGVHYYLWSDIKCEKTVCSSPRLFASCYLVFSKRININPTEALVLQRNIGLLLRFHPLPVYLNSTIKVRTIALALHALLIFLHAKSYAMMLKPTGGSEQKIRLNHIVQKNFCLFEKWIMFTKFTEYGSSQQRYKFP